MNSQPMPATDSPNQQSGTGFSKQMRVLHIPYSEPTTNSYQRRLTSELEQLGVTIETEEYSPPLGLPTFARAVRAGSYDVVHISFINHFLLSDSRPLSVVKTGSFLSFLSALRARGSRIVWTVHDLFEHARRDVDLERRLKRLITTRFCDALIVHFPSAVNAVIEGYDLPREHTEKMAVIPHGHYIDEYKNTVSRETARRKFGFSDETVFLFFGLIRPYKQVPGLIHTFSNLDNSDARLVVAGRPKDNHIRSAVQHAARADDRVHLRLELIPDDEVQYLMNAADVVVLPFEDIFTSGSAILAMSFSRALIAPRMGSIEETVADTNDPLIYDPSHATIDSLLAALQRAMTVDLAAIGKSNYATIANNNWQGIAEQTLAVYEQCGAPRNN